MPNSSNAPSRAPKPNLPALNGRNIRHLRYVRSVGRSIKAALSSVAALALLVGLGVGLPAYGDALTEAHHVEYEIATRQSFEVSAQAATLSVERDSYDATEPPPIVWPVTANRVSSHYGPRAGCAAGCSTYHLGVDFDPGNGTPVRSIASGTVISVNKPTYSTLGQHIWIQHELHGQVVVSVYAHLQSGSIRVSTGDTVKVGQNIGLVGSTGLSTGPHLHFELHIGGRAINPLPWLQQYALTF